MAKPAPIWLNSSIARSRLAAVVERCLLGIDQQIAIGPVLVASHAAAQLMQVGQPVAIGLVDEDRVGVGNVETALDDRRGQQQIELVIDEVEHHLLRVLPRPFARGRSDARLGHDSPQSRGQFLDVVHAVVDKENLPAAIQFAHHRVANQLGSNRATRVSIASRSSGGVSRFEISRKPNSDMCKRARNGRGGHRQHVDHLSQCFQTFLDIDAKPLLLVDDRPVPDSETDVGLRQPVRADDDVDRAVGQAVETVALLLGVQKRLTDAAIWNGNSAIRRVNVRRCCSARTVVGTSTAT